jgi:hypothetical protein
MADPVLIALRRIVRPVLVDPHVRHAYSEFIRTGGVHEHERLCRRLDAVVLPNLYTLMGIESPIDEYEIVFPDNKNRPLHRIELRLNEGEYRSPNMEYTIWRHSTPFTGERLNGVRVITRSIEPAFTELAPASEITSPDSSEPTSVYAGSTEDDPVVITPSSGYYLFIDGLTGSNSTWDSVSGFLGWTPTLITVTGSGSTDTVDGVWTTTFTGQPPSIGVSCEDDFYYTIEYPYSDEELNGTTGVFSKTFSVYSTSLETVPTEPPSLDTAAAISVVFTLPASTLG